MLSKIKKAFNPDHKGAYFQELKRPSSDFNRSEEIRRTLTQGKLWEEEFEWRISTYMNSRIEPVHKSNRDWFRVTVESGYEFSCHTPTIDRAIEFLTIYERLIIDMFYILGWPSWASKNQLYPD